MKTFSNIEYWAKTHHPKWIDIIRILLGLVLIAKGIAFIRQTGLLTDMLLDSTGGLRTFVFIHYLIGIHIAAGLMITVGLLTRIAVLIQIPLLIGAVIQLNVSKDFFVFNPEFPFLILTITLLIFFFIYGSGSISIDSYLKRHEE
ncbi:MAG: hypothetical protein HGGPFJEG_02478 [Ignavibacteria bacterium]|nr:hypothetical protein [Ignavibacteria bacterium]